MSRKPRMSQRPQTPLVDGETIFWFAVGAMAYSLAVPILALSSLAHAESLLRFSYFYQVAVFVLILLVTVEIFGRVAIYGWQDMNWLSSIAVFMLLFSNQPNEQCCTRLVAAISGMLPVSEVSLNDVLFHLLPVGGCALLMLTYSRMRQRASNAKRGKQKVR